MKKLLQLALLLGIISSTVGISYGTTPIIGPHPNALPSFKNGTNVDVTTAGNNMNIKINGGQNAVGTANFNSYDVGRNATVNYQFSAHNQTALNKVDAAGGMSEIYGNITNSSTCPACGYESTGKVILLNPNGIIFGNGANINVNSFTAAAANGTYNANTKNLTLSKNTNNGLIIVKDNAKIYGDKGVTLAGNNIYTYSGSQISTSTANNLLGDTAFGKVKLVTSDGVTFNYANNGGTDSIANVKNSSRQMNIGLDGDITSGNIDVRNTSTNANSNIGLYNANLKAVKAKKGNDGNIWLTANNKIDSESSSIIAQGDLLLQAKNDVDINNSKTYAGKKLDINSTNANVNLENNDINSWTGIDIKAKKDIIAVKNELEALGDINVSSTSSDATIKSNYMHTNSSANITAKKNLYASGNTISANDKINLIAKNNNMVLDNNSLNAFYGTVNAEAKQNLEAYNNNNKGGFSTNFENKATGQGIYDLYDMASGPFEDNISLNSKSGKLIAVNNDFSGDIKLDAKNEVHVNSNKLNSMYHDVTINSQSGKVYAERNDITAGGNVNINAKNDVNLNSNTIKADKGFFADWIDAPNNVNLTSKSGSLSANSNYIETYGDINVSAKKDLVFKDNILSAKNINLASQSNEVNLKDNSLNADKYINVNAKKDVNVYANNLDAHKEINLNSSSAMVNVKSNCLDTYDGIVNITAKKDVNVASNTIIADKINLKSGNKKVNDVNNFKNPIYIYDLSPSTLPVFSKTSQKTSNNSVKISNNTNSIGTTYWNSFNGVNN